MPEAPIPFLEEINSNPEFRAKEITKEEFETLWEQAHKQRMGSAPDLKVAIT